VCNVHVLRECLELALTDDVVVGMDASAEGESAISRRPSTATTLRRPSTITETGTGDGSKSDDKPGSSGESTSPRIAFSSIHMVSFAGPSTPSGSVGRKSVLSATAVSAAGTAAPAADAASPAGTPIDKEKKRTLTKTQSAPANGSEEAHHESGLRAWMRRGKKDQKQSRLMTVCVMVCV
jgi:hypothetical protein